MAHKKLVNQENQLVIAEINEDEVVIEDPILKKYMEEKGIFIPPALRDEYGSKEYIKADDPEFAAAFEKVFVPSSYRQAVYSWVEES